MIKRIALFLVVFLFSVVIAEKYAGESAVLKRDRKLQSSQITIKDKIPLVLEYYVEDKLFVRDDIAFEVDITKNQTYCFDKKTDQTICIKVIP